MSIQTCLSPIVIVPILYYLDKYETFQSSKQEYWELRTTYPNSMQCQQNETTDNKKILKIFYAQTVKADFQKLRAANHSLPESLSMIDKFEFMER